MYVIEVTAGVKIPRKGGRSIRCADLSIINKSHLAPYDGANLDVTASDGEKMRGDKPLVFTNLRSGEGMLQVMDFMRREGGLAHSIRKSAA